MKRKHAEPSQAQPPRRIRRVSKTLAKPIDNAKGLEPFPSPARNDSADLTKYQLDLPDAEVLYIPALFPSDGCQSYYRELLALPDWTRPTLTVFGRKKLQSRKVCVFGDPKIEFRYSGATIDVSDKYPESVREIQRVVEEVLGTTFNVVLLNLYEDGDVYIGGHSDEFRGHREENVIAAVSLGAERTFIFTHKNSKARTKFVLGNGSLLVMKGETQKHYKHEIPKELKVSEGRISLTFRQRAG